MAYIHTRQTVPAVGDETVEYRAEKKKQNQNKQNPQKTPKHIEPAENVVFVTLGELVQS